MSSRIRDFTTEGALEATFGRHQRKTDANKIEKAIRSEVSLDFQDPTPDSALLHRVLVDAQGEFKLNGGVVKRTDFPIFSGALDIAVTDRRIWVNPFPWTVRVTHISEKHATAETTAATLTAYIEKTPNGVAVGGTGAVSIMNGTFDLKGTANTVQTATLATNKHAASPNLHYIDLEQGDSLSWNISGTATELATVTLTIYADLGNKAGCVTVIAADNTRCIDRIAHVANVPKTMTYAACVFRLGGSAGSNAMIERRQGTEAAAAGDTLITNDTTGFELDGTVNTVQYATLTSTVANLRLHLGDRFGIDFSGTVTACRDLVIVIGYTAAEDAMEVNFHGLLDAETDNVSTEFFIANRPLQIVDVREVHATADVGEDIDLEINTGTVAPGSGTGVLTDDTGAGFDGGGTANTVQVGTLDVLGVRQMLAGDRLNAKMSDSDDTMLGVCMTVMLKAA